VRTLTDPAARPRDPVQPEDDLGERGQGDVHLYVHLGRERDHGSDRILGVKKPAGVRITTVSQYTSARIYIMDCGTVSDGRACRAGLATEGSDGDQAVIGHVGFGLTAKVPVANAS
jgi:hypothetical protein